MIRIHFNNEISTKFLNSLRLDFYPIVFRIIIWTKRTYFSATFSFQTLGRTHASPIVVEEHLSISMSFVSYLNVTLVQVTELFKF